MFLYPWQSTKTVRIPREACRSPRGHGVRLNMDVAGAAAHWLYERKLADLVEDGQSSPCWALFPLLAITAPADELGVLQATPFRNGRRGLTPHPLASLHAAFLLTGRFLVRRFFLTSKQHIRWSQPPEAEREGERERETLKQLVPVQGLVKRLIPAALHQSLRS